MSNQNIIHLGKVIDANKLHHYLDTLDELETIIQRYGTDFILPDYPCWMEYRNRGPITGAIAFSRNLLKHPLLKEMVEIISPCLQSVFPSTRTVYPDRVHIIRTMGSIIPHRDEAGRNCCINIGLKNSIGAITKISTDGILTNIESNHMAIQVEEGHAYLLNTNQYHCVQAINSFPRYLITYGFGIKFDVLAKEFTAK